MDKLGVHNEALQEKYLGMPTEVGRAPIGTFAFLPDRAWKRSLGQARKRCLKLSSKPYQHIS
jgi:hypothetical protein